MGKQFDNYAKYKAANENLTEFEWIQSGPEFRQLDEEAQQNGKFLNYNKKAGQANDNKSEGTYLLPDGRVAEFQLAHGWMRLAAVWQNEADYQAYREALPFAVYYEF